MNEDVCHESPGRSTFYQPGSSNENAGPSFYIGEDVEFDSVGAGIGSMEPDLKKQRVNDEGEVLEGVSEKSTRDTMQGSVI